MFIRNTLQRTWECSQQECRDNDLLCSSCKLEKWDTVTATTNTTAVSGNTCRAVIWETLYVVVYLGHMMWTGAQSSSSSDAVQVEILDVPWPHQPISWPGSLSHLFPVTHRIMFCARHVCTWYFPFDTGYRSNPFLFLKNSCPNPVNINELHTKLFYLYYFTVSSTRSRK